MKQKVIAARVADDVYDSIAAKASAEGVSISAIAARLLGESLKADARADEKPAWAIAHEERIAKLESQQQAQSQSQGSRKGKRR